MPDISSWLRTLPSDWTDGCDEPLFESACECYQSPGRFYHTWNHVVDCVDKLRTFPCDSGQAVFLALVFHDAVYVPGSGDNEERSAQLATRLLRERTSLPQEFVATIARYIRATKSHLPAAGNHDRGLDATLDIDMSILGAPREAYQAYAEGVRREYCPAVTSAARFTAGRVAFLSKVLTLPAIFHTREGVARWEMAARINIAMEIEALEADQGTIWRMVSSMLGRLSGNRH